MFAQVPPPEHGQSRMVLLALETLRESPEAFDVYHVNARFSNSLEDIGESSVGKMILIGKYLTQAIRLRVHTRQPLLYYVPGPVKWSSVLRDWVLLTVLRLCYSRVVFHWHAIGHGEWAHGSERLTLRGPRWMDRAARKISAWVLAEPFASIAVSSNSRKDTLVVASRREWIICNGIKDPCPAFDEEQAPLRLAQQQALATAEPPCFKVLFLSHGTEEKGTLDALDCMAGVLEQCDPSWRFQLTFAGGISESVRSRFDSRAGTLRSRWPDRIHIREEGYLAGENKHRCFLGHDIFLAPSRWESFGLTVTEAMAYGMPIVAAASDGVQGVLPEDHPYLVPVADAPALARSLLACCAALREHPLLDEGRALRHRFLTFYQIKDFSDSLTRAFLDWSDGAPRPDRSAVGDAAALHIPASDIPPAPIRITAYLADQNPGYDRSFGISRMSHVVLEALKAGGQVSIEAIASKTSQQAPESVDSVRILPWGTRGKSVRLLTDHLHPLFMRGTDTPEMHYFPKGYLPLLDSFCRPSVVTIHDTIIQYDEDHYPKWRNSWEYAYWALMLKHTLRKADRILTVSESSKKQIHDFMDRHGIPRKRITVTYEPCLYEKVPQPVKPPKENYVIHLASCEPHKRTAHLLRWWHEAETKGRNLPTLHLIGSVPPEVEALLANSHSIVRRPFLEDRALQAAYLAARALILPSEIEGFGLPALEAYYLGTPVCFVKGTSVEEILSGTTNKGGFLLESAESLFSALDEVMRMSPEEIHEYGIKLRETYAASKVAQKMVTVFAEVRKGM